MGMLPQIPVDYDPMGDEGNPQIISFDDVSSAAFRIQGGIIRTPCIKSKISEGTDMTLYLKHDFMQYTGSFKERGARNALLLLPAESRLKGVISASLGNHAQGLSYHGQKLGIPVTVVMPKVAPIMKIQKCKDFNAEVVVYGENMAEATQHAMILANIGGLTYINGYDHPHIMAGQGTIGLEILDQVPDVHAIIVPVGGGGLLAGVATVVKHLNPYVEIIGVESERCASMHAALQNDCPVYTPIISTIADGLAVPTVGYNAFHTAKPLLDKLVVVKEEWIARAILRLVEKEKCVVEGGGAVGVAAVLSGILPDLRGKTVVCILSGGNIDTTILGRCLDRGLAAEGRLIKFKATVSDRPGGIAELCKLLASIGVSIKDIIQERAWVVCDIFSVEVTVTCETRSLEHAVDLKALLEQYYTDVVFTDSINSSLRDVESGMLPEIIMEPEIIQ